MNLTMFIIMLLAVVVVTGLMTIISVNIYGIEVVSKYVDDFLDNTSKRLTNFRDDLNNTDKYDAGFNFCGGLICGIIVMLFIIIVPIIFTLGVGSGAGVVAYAWICSKRYNKLTEQKPIKTIWEYMVENKSDFIGRSIRNNMSGEKTTITDIRLSKDLSPAYLIITGEGFYIEIVVTSLMIDLCDDKIITFHKLYTNHSWSIIIEDPVEEVEEETTIWEKIVEDKNSYIGKILKYNNNKTEIVNILFEEDYGVTYFKIVGVTFGFKWSVDSLHELTVEQDEKGIIIRSQNNSWHILDEVPEE